MAIETQVERSGLRSHAQTECSMILLVPIRFCLDYDCSYYSGREEADRLIASLRSYVKENGTAEEQIDYVNKEEHRRTALVNQVLALESAPSNGQLSDAQRWREERTKARQEQNSNLWPSGSGKENGTPAGTSEVRLELSRGRLDYSSVIVIWLLMSVYVIHPSCTTPLTDMCFSCCLPGWRNSGS